MSGTARRATRSEPHRYFEWKNPLSGQVLTLREMPGVSPHTEILKALTTPEVVEVELTIDGVKTKKEVVFHVPRGSPSYQRMPKAPVENRIGFISLDETEEEFDISITAEEQRSWELVHHKGLEPSERYPKPRPCVWYGAEDVRPHEMLLRVPGDRWVLVFGWSGLNRELTKQEACYWIYRINGYELPIDLREFSTGPAVVDFPRLKPAWSRAAGAGVDGAHLKAPAADEDGRDPQPSPGAAGCLEVPDGPRGPAPPPPAAPSTATAPEDLDRIAMAPDPPIPPTPSNPPPEKTDYDAIYAYLVGVSRLEATIFAFMRDRHVATEKEIRDGPYKGKTRTWDAIKSAIKRLKRTLGRCLDPGIKDDAHRVRFGWSDRDRTITKTLVRRQ
jgi:hypothetical protein